MTSPPHRQSNEDAPASEHPGAASAVRPARITLPGPNPPARTTSSVSASDSGRPDPTLPDASGAPVEITLDAGELERVALVDLPALARYGRYELLGRLAYGGMAEIFLAREAHVSAHRMLVIKRVLPHVAEDQHFVDMFVDEATLAMQLNHPNICHVYSFGEEDGTYYIAMEWVNGKPLSKVIRNARAQGGLPVPMALKIIANIAEALDYAHRACDAKGEPLGIVHRDVSPQNIMVSFDGAVKLLDFGIAKASSHSTRTEAGVIKGKFAYMSPQQCVGEPIDGRADIFALGVCLYEALTGKNPYRCKTEFETMTKIVSEPTPSARGRRPDVPEEVDAILAKALMKQPERRYQSAGEMQLALEEVIARLGVVVSGARIGEHIGKLFVDDMREGPQLDMRMSVAPRITGLHGEDSKEVSPPRPRPSGATELDAEAIFRHSEPPKERSRAGLHLLVAVLLVALAGVGGVLAWTIFEPRGVPAPVASSGAAEPPLAAAAPTESASAVTSFGSVFVRSTPAGATVQLGDRPNAGVTPLEIGMIAPGTHEVRLTLAGHRSWTGEVEVEGDQRASVNAKLAPVQRRRPRPAEAPPGELSLNTQPWSKVYLGGRLLGTTPLGRVSLPSGNQRLRLVDRDGNEHRRTVQVPPGDHVARSFNLNE